MSAEDRVRWDKVYRQRSRDNYPDPNPLLLQFTPPVHLDDKLGALDLAGGLGQDALWLAQQGYIVDLMDISRTALKRARAEMTMQNIRNINLLQVDVDDITLKPDTYHIVAVTRYLKRDLFDAIKASVRSGGRVIYDTYNVRYLDIVPQFNPSFLLEVGELQDLFSTWSILHEEEVDHNSRIVAVKP